MERVSVSIMKASELAGVSRRTIYNWLHDGRLQFMRTAGGSVRIYEDSLFRDHADGEFGRPARPAGVSVSTPQAAARPRAWQFGDPTPQRQ